MNLDIFVLHGQFRGPRVEALSGYLSPFSSHPVLLLLLTCMLLFRALESLGETVESHHVTN